MANEKKVILSRKEWEDFLAGYRKTLTIFKETDLHHEFGDDPEKYIVRVKIVEMPKLSKGARTQRKLGRSKSPGPPHHGAH